MIKGKFCLLLVLAFFMSIQLSAQVDNNNALELKVGMNMPLGDLKSDEAQVGMNIGLQYKRLLTNRFGVYGKGAFAAIGFDADEFYKSTEGFENPSVGANRYTNFSLGAYYQMGAGKMRITPYLGYLYSNLSKGEIEVSHPGFDENPQKVEFGSKSASGFELGVQLDYSLSDKVYLGLDGGLWSAIHDNIEIVGQPNEVHREESGAFRINFTVGYSF